MPDPDQQYEPASREALEDILVAGRDFARMVRGQYEGFIEVGFTEAQSLRLSATWMKTHMEGGRDA